MAYLPPGQRRMALDTLPKPPVKKKPPPKPVGSFDPYRSTDINSVVDYLTRLQAGGPDYTGIAPPPAPEDLRQEALTQSAWQLMPAQLQYERQQMQSRAGRETSQQAATAFTQALSGILQGGKTGDEGMAFAKENYGGSYLGVIAAQMGADLFKQITHDFDQQDFELADKLGTVMATQPEIMQKVYDSLVETEQARVKGQMQDAETDYKNRVQALGFRIGELRKSEKAQGGADAPEIENFKDGTSRQWNPETRTWDVVASAADAGPRVFQTAQGVFAIDEATGQVVWEKKTGKAKTTKTTTQIVEQPDGSKVLVNKANGKKIAVVAPPDPADTASGGKSPSASSQSTTVGRAQKAAAKILTDNGGLLDRIWAKYDPGLDATPEQKAKATQQYQSALSRQFGSAMFKVITAIAPHLKAIGYSPARIKWEAYQIVRQSGMTPRSSYKAPKPPKAEAARAAASNVAQVTPKTGIVTSTPWKGTHITDNLDWNNGERTAADIMGAPGTPVGAPEDGTIVRWGSAQGGQALYFQGVSGKRYWLGHIDNMAPVGTRVMANQPIAVISAAHPRPHLHIDVTGGGV